MFKAIKEFFVGKTPAERHPLDAVTTPNIPEPVMATETVVIMEPPKEQMIPIPFVPEAAPAVVEAAPAKAPRKPRAAKAAPVAAVKEKAPAKTRAPKAAPKSKKV